MKRILYLEASPTRYGSTISLSTLVSALDRSRYEPIVAINKHNQEAETLLESGVRVIKLALEGRPAGTATSRVQTRSKNIPWVVRSIRDRVQFRSQISQLQRAIDDVRPHLLHFNNQIASNRFGYYCNRRGAALVQHLRTGPLTVNSSIVRLASQADEFVCISNYVLGSLRGEISPGAPASVVYNPVGERFFSVPSPGDSIRRKGLKLLQLGRIEPYKGQINLLKALLVLVRQGSRSLEGLRVRFLGDDPTKSSYGRELVRFIDVNGLGRFVSFHDYVEDVAAELHECDCLVHVTSAAEGFGRVVAEAQAVGLPTIVSSLGALPELVEDGVTGYVVRSPDELAFAIERLGDSETLRRQMGLNSRRSALRFSAAEHADKIESVYSRILRSNQK